MEYATETLDVMRVEGIGVSSSSGKLILEYQHCLQLTAQVYYHTSKEQKQVARVKEKANTFTDSLRVRYVRTLSACQG